MMIKKNVPRILSFLPCLAACVISILIESDWEYFGILMIFVFYFFKDNKKKMYIGISLVLFAAVLNSYIDAVIDNGLVSPLKFFIHLFGIVALIPISYYNGEYTKSKLRYLMYLFYPLHLMVIYLLSTIILK